MRRYKAGRRALCCGRWAGAQPLLRPQPRPFAGAQAQRLARGQEQGPGRTRGAEEADKGPRGRCPGRHGGPGQGGGCQSALQHPHKGRRAGAQDEGARGAGRAPGSAGGGLEGEEGRMRKNGLRRHYDRLTPEERFRLDVSAMARGDAAESERLVGSCPKLSYRMNDRSFAGRWMGAMDITLRTYLPLQKLLCKLRMIEAFRHIVPYAQALSRSVATEAYFVGHKAGSYQAWDATAQMPRPPAWSDPDAEEPEGADEDGLIGRDMEDLDRKLNKYGELLPEIMDRMERELADDALSLWSGFETFCAEGMGGGRRRSWRPRSRRGRGRGHRAHQGAEDPGGALRTGTERSERRRDRGGALGGLARDRGEGHLVSLRGWLRSASGPKRSPLVGRVVARRKAKG